MASHDLPQAQQLTDKVNTELAAKQSSRRQLQATAPSCFNPGDDQSLWIDDFLETFDCACLADVVEECGS